MEWGSLACFMTVLRRVEKAWIMSCEQYSKITKETVEDYAKDYAEEREKIGLEKGRSEQRRNAICKMLQNGFSREMILLLDYSETELQAVEQEMFVQI